MTMAGEMIPDAQVKQEQDVIGRQMARLHDIADINDKTIDNPSLKPRERLERRR